jgi:hypothetical protein
MVESTPVRLLTARFSLVGVARNGLWAVVLAALAYYALFRLPFRFPPQQRLVSPSYAFGFNNSVAILAMAGLLGLVALFYLLRRRRACEPRIEFPLGCTVPGRRSSIVALALMGLFYAGLTFAMYLYDIRSEPGLMWETRHLLYRTILMDVYGLRPYTEVAAEYGPILTYAPLYMYWLLKPFGASHELAYFASHLLLNLAGLWCAYYVLSRAIMPARARLVAFSILAVAGFGLWMGVSGTLVRYLFPFASLLLGHRVVIWALSSRGRTVCWAGAAVAILTLLFGNILLSSDAGVAFALAWLGYALLMVRYDIRVLAVSVISLATAALLCWLFLPAAYYGTLLWFSKGAANLPLLPAAHLLLYILTMFVVVPPLLAVSVREPATGGLPGAALCGAMGILCVVMAPGALGRCDPPHVLFFGMGASMLLMIRLANISRRLFAAYAIAYAGVFIVLMQIVNLVVFYGISPPTLLSREGIANAGQKLRSASGTEHPDMATLSALDGYPRLGLPFASFEDPAVERYVLSRHQLQPDYYVSVVGVYDAAALERKLREVGKADYLLVPRRFESRPGSSRDPCAGFLKRLQEWFLYPANLPCRADPLDAMTALRSFISDHYIPDKQVGSWLVMRRISGASTMRPDH